MLNAILIKELNLIQVSFSYDPHMVALIKTIPGRKFNPDNKNWFIPISSAKIFVKTFAKYETNISKEIYTTIDEGADKKDALSISELNHQISLTINKSFPSAIWIIGEIMDFKKNSINNKHKFFKIIEKNPKSQQTLSEANIVMWEGVYSKISEKLNNCSKPFKLNDGIEIKVLVEVSFIGKGGYISLVTLDIDPYYTIGKLAENREKILNELDEMGLMNKNSKIPFPRFATKIGVISSLSSDGFNDFLTEIKSSKIGFHLTCVNANVQGKHVENSIIQALEYLQNKSPDLECVVIVRGGGSSSDLLGFDSKKLAIKVAEFPIKILSGIGHERDKTVIDFLVQSEKTPTKVATYLIDRIKNDYEEMRLMTINIVKASKTFLNYNKDSLTSTSNLFISSSYKSISKMIYQLKDKSLLIKSLCNHVLKLEHVKISNQINNLSSFSKAKIKNSLIELNNFGKLADALSPKKILKRGYVYVTQKKHGQIKKLPSKKFIEKNPDIKLHFHDGNIYAKLKIGE